MKGRLAAILVADVVGYSRLMSLDEVGTLVALKSRHKAVLVPVAARHRGRIFKITGDGALIEFGSAIDAVQCAIELQERMDAANAGQAEDRRIILRVAVNLGEVMVEGSDIYGEGVNVAARLEGIADPGGLCISAKVYEEVHHKLSLVYEDLGELQLKNIVMPVRAFRVTKDTGRFVAPAPLPLPAKPSIAALPFTNISEDPDQQYFSDGITEDILTELSRFHALFVIARNSSFAFKGRSVKAQAIARELGASYIIEGSVRRIADRVRISVQLIDGGTGNHLWAERYDRDMHDIFAVQDEVARSVASIVSGRVEAAGCDRAARLSATALKAYDLVLRAKALMSQYTRADNEQALACAERAVKLDPTSARAHTLSACCIRYNYMAYWTTDRQNALAKAYELAKRGVALDETDSFAHCILALIHLARREFDEARFEILMAIELNPNDPEARRYYGLILVATGQPDAGLEQIDLAERLNPFDTRWVPWIKGIAYFTARRYAEAIAALKHTHDPNNEVRGWLAASFANTGRLKEAKDMLEEFLQVARSDMAVFPGLRLRDWEPYWHGALEYQNEKDFDHLLEALRKAGLPD